MAQLGLSVQCQSPCSKLAHQTPQHGPKLTIRVPASTETALSHTAFPPSRAQIHCLKLLFANSWLKWHS